MFGESQRTLTSSCAVQLRFLPRPFPCCRHSAIEFSIHKTFAFNSPEHCKNENRWRGGSSDKRKRLEDEWLGRITQLVDETVTKRLDNVGIFADDVNRKSVIGTDTSKQATSGTVSRFTSKPHRNIAHHENVFLYLWKLETTHTMFTVYRAWFVCYFANVYSLRSLPAPPLRYSNRSRMFVHHLRDCNVCTPSISVSQFYWDLRLGAFDGECLCARDFSHLTDSITFHEWIW